MHRARLLLSILAVIILLAGLLPGPLGAQEIPAGQTVDGPVVVRLYFETRANLDRLATDYDVWKVKHAPVPGTDRDDGYAVMMLSPEEYQQLTADGYRMEIDEAQTEQVRNPDSIPGFPCYNTVAEGYALLNQWNTQYPNLVQITDIGDSWEKVQPGGAPGFDINEIRITNENIGGTKPRFFLMAEIHAREYATGEIALRMAQYLLQNYGTDPTITFFVDYNEIYIVPFVNPDGRLMEEQNPGVMWRKNTDNDDGCSYNYGVDLNRNYAFKWGCCGGSSGSCSAETYRGPGRNTLAEPETQAIQDRVLALFPDQNGNNGDDQVPPAAPNDATGLFLTLHSAAGLVLWPWGWTGTDAPNGPALQMIGQKFATYNGYTPQQSYDLYVTDGTTDDWTYGRLGMASFTFEISGEFYEPCSTFEQIDWPDNRDALLYAWKIAKTPYMTSYGPDALNTAATPGAVAPGTPVQLTATINDTQNGNQTVTGAEYYVVPLHDATPPGAPGTGTAMSPADGNWNSTIEGATATVDTSSFATGVYLLAVRGKDAGNNWGPMDATFLYVIDPATAPVIEGYVLDGASGNPLDGTVTAGTFNATTDPATGYYSMTVVSGTYNMTASSPNHGDVTVNGVVAHDYETTRQDFMLYPICEAFADDMESGINGWTTGGSPNTWAQTTGNSHSPTHSWTDSPSGNYTDYNDNWAQSPAIDLTGYTGITLDFWHSYQTESGYDYANVEYSTNGGGSWSMAAVYNGSSGGWEEVAIPLSALDNQANVRLRFHFTSDQSVTYDGWYVDDVVLTGGGSGCVPPSAPTADFTSNSPVLLGDPMAFTNMTIGNPPPTFEWDFGDGVGTSTDRDPTYTYLAAGTYTVTLVATNSEGSDTVQHPVVVTPLACEPVFNADFNWSPTTPVVAQTVSFNGTAEGTAPIDYSWDLGDGTTASGASVSHAYSADGVYTVVMTASNCTTGTDVVSYDITVVAPHIAVTTLPTVTLNPGESAPGALTITDTGDYTLTWALAEATPLDWLDETPTAGVLAAGEAQTVNLAYTAPMTPGVYSGVLQVTSDDPLQPQVDVDAVLVVNELPPACEPMTGTDFIWSPAMPYITDTVTLTATVLGGDAPFTYTWNLGDSTTALGAVVTHTYAASGTYSVLLSVTNCDGTTVVTATHEIEVQEVVVPPETFVVYLPIVVKNH